MIERQTYAKTLEQFLAETQHFVALPREGLGRIDVQNDFCPGGLLAVESGPEVVAPLNNVTLATERHEDIDLFDSLDWHDENNKEHFDLWGKHCIQGTLGADRREDLIKLPSGIIIRKGQGIHEHGYSAFDGVTDEGISLEDELRRRRIGTVYLGGLLLNFCVGRTVEGGLDRGFRMVVLEDATRGLDLPGNEGDTERTKAELQAKGAFFTTTREVIKLWNGRLRDVA